MDKKNYFEPKMDVIEINYSGVLCASDPIDPDMPNTNIGDSDDPDDIG